MSVLRNLMRLIKGESSASLVQAEDTQRALVQLISAQEERKDAALATHAAAVAATTAARSNVRAYRAEGERIKQRSEAQVQKRNPGTTGYAREQVENLLKDLDRDVARAARGEGENGVPE